MSAARAEIESLLRARKLDVTLTTAAAWRGTDEDRIAATGSPRGRCGARRRRAAGAPVRGRRAALGRALGAVCQHGGRRGGARRSRRAGRYPRSIRSGDRRRPPALDLARLLWIRESGDADRALKAMNLVLQAGGFGVVVLDLADVSAPALRQFPITTWMRHRARDRRERRPWRCCSAPSTSRAAPAASPSRSIAPATVADEWAGATARDRAGCRGLTRPAAHCLSPAADGAIVRIPSTTISTPSIPDVEPRSPDVGGHGPAESGPSLAAGAVPDLPCACTPRCTATVDRSGRDRARFLAADRAASGDGTWCSMSPGCASARRRRRRLRRDLARAGCTPRRWHRRRRRRRRCCWLAPAGGLDVAGGRSGKRRCARVPLGSACSNSWTS